MVQLKPGTDEKPEGLFKFQFHNGTIKTALGDEVLEGIRISIPEWDN